jgi:L-ribulose-5-phosphate 3-epimerase
MRTTRREFVKAGIAATCGAAALSAGAAGELVHAAGGALRSSGQASPSRTGGLASAGQEAKASAGQAGKTDGGQKDGAQKGAALAVKKGLVWDMLPAKLSVAERMKLARACGFDVVQAPTTPDQRAAEELGKAATDAGIRIDSVMNIAHWKYPLSSGDKDVVAKSMEGMATSLQNAKLWGSDAVLLVPAVVNPQTTYADAWQRSQGRIRQMLPAAEEMKVVIAIEEVWNKFLLSPLEMAMYVDDFDSPWLKAWFDVGNVVLYGYPQDWIHALDKRIYKVHLKDFKRKENGYAWVNLGEGDVDWGAVRQAFADVGYAGSVIAELEPGDEAYLRDVSKRIDRLVLGAG